MEPTTILAIANFGMSLLKKSGPNPMDALVEMLKGINQKLDVIKDELEEIHKKLFDLPQEIDYVQRINDLKKEFSVVDYYNRLLKKDIEEFGEKRGSKEFIKKNGPDVENTILEILKTVGILVGYYDPITINLICVASDVDFQLSKIIERKSSYQESSQIEYFSFLKPALYDSPDGLEHRIAVMNEEINNQINYKHINYRQNINRYWECTDWDSPRMGGGRPHFKFNFTRENDAEIPRVCISSRMRVKNSSNVINLHHPTFKIKELTNDEKSIHNYLYENGFNEKINLEFEKLAFKTISKQEAESHNGKYVIKTRSTYYNDKQRNGKRKKYPSPKPYPIQHNIFKEDLQLTINKYILNSISILNAVNTLNKINNYNF